VITLRVSARFSVILKSDECGYELVTERVDALSTERFLATNKALSDMYGYELDARMFASRRIFDPRRAAMMVYERLHVAGDFFEIATPIHFRQPAECLAVQQAFQVVYGESLEEAIKKRLGRVTPNLPEQTREVLIDRYVRGNGRCPLSVDILGRYRGIEPEPGVWQWEYKSLTEDEESAMDIAAIMDQDLELGEFDRPILDFLAGRSYDERSRIERAFYDLTDPNMALREALRNCLSPEAFEMADLLLAGVDLHPLVTAIYTEPQQTEQLGELPPSLVRLVREAFERAHFVALDEFLLQQHPVPEREDEIMDRLSLVLMPEIFAARETLLRVSRTTVDQIDDIRALCRGPLGLVMAFERGFDMLFPRLRVHLKYAASRMAVSAPVFAELILNLEGVDPEVTARILEFFDAVDIHSLLSTLRHYQHEQRVIEEAYDLLNPEAQLRRSIKEMKVDPDLINETLLHLEGYSAKDVALELHELIQSYSGHELGVAMLAVFAIPTPQRPNPRIPEDMNWMDEMAYQVLLAYQHDYGADLMEVARAKGLDTYQLEELTGRVFGIEATSLARELFALLKANKEGGLSQEPTEQRICSYVESRGVRYRSRLVRAYNSFWAHTPGFESLLDDVATSFRDMASKKKLHALLLGVGAEGRSRKVSSIVPIQ
jgi:ATP phosphoribosyltransferase regulatory subunit HisZ